MLTGDNGILKRAEEARTKTDIATIQEKIKLSYLATLSETYKPENNRIISTETLQEQIRTDGLTDAIVLEDDIFEVHTQGKKFKINQNGDVIYIDDINEDVQTADTINKMALLQSTGSNIVNEKENITKVYFRKEKIETIEQKYNNATIKADLTFENYGKVYGWLSNDSENEGKYILYIESDGITKLVSGSSLFVGFSNLKTIDFSNVDTSECTSFEWMFANCFNLENLDVSKFNTENVTKMPGMFSRCKKLTSLNLSNFNTSKVKEMQSMFNECEILRDLSIDNFDTKLVENMQLMFNSCKALEELDLSNFDTSNVQSMRNMFCACVALRSLNLSSFNTSNVTVMDDMFNSCRNLVTIYASNLWNIKEGTSTARMFSNAQQIKGGQGTTYNASNIDGAYAKIDEGTSSPGYFTYSQSPTSSSGDKYIALTFDDGPNETTTVEVLNLLEEYNAHASFFLIGNNITESNKAVIRRAHNMGCEICSHSKSHTNMNEMSEAEIATEISYVDTLVNQAIGTNTSFFRAPYLRYSDTMLNSINKTSISGLGASDSDSSVTIDTRAQKILEAARDGMIVLLHDFNGNSNTVEALKIVIPRLQQEGYKFLNLTELFNQKQVTPETKMVYNQVVKFDGNFNKTLFTGEASYTSLNKTELINAGDNYALKVEYTGTKPPNIVLQKWTNGSLYKEVNPMYYNNNVAYYHAKDILIALQQANTSYDEINDIKVRYFENGTVITKVDLYT